MQTKSRSVLLQPSEALFSVWEELCACITGQEVSNPYMKNDQKRTIVIVMRTTEDDSVFRENNNNLVGKMVRQEVKSMEGR